MEFLTLQVLWPFSWHEKFTSPVDPLLVMRVLSMLEGAGHHHEHQDGADQSEAVTARLDLGLQLLAHLLSSELPVPDCVALEVNAEQLSWNQEAEISAGSAGQIVLYPSQQLQVPLALPATILSCQQAVNGLWHITAQWGPFRDDVQAWLDRTLFRYHRRQISNLRLQDK